MLAAHGTVFQRPSLHHESYTNLHWPGTSWCAYNWSPHRALAGISQAHAAVRHDCCQSFCAVSRMTYSPDCAARKKVSALASYAARFTLPRQRHIASALSCSISLLQYAIDSSIIITTDRRERAPVPIVDQQRKPHFV